MTDKPALKVDLNDRTWIDRSRPAEDLAPMFSFVLWPKVYVGDPNSMRDIQSGEFDRALETPDIGARNPLRPTAKEVLGQEAILAAYYRDIRGQRDAAFGLAAQYYWVRLDFVSEAIGQTISFPWWDRIGEAAELMSWLRTASGADDFFDADQGWLFKAERRGPRFYFQHGDLDSRDEYANLYVDRAVFLQRLDIAQSEVSTVVGRLKAQLGIDPWS